MNRFIKSCFGISILLLVASGSALATQIAVVRTDGVPVFQGPGMNYPVVETVNRGQRMWASDGSRDGFYYVRTPKGALAWISGEGVTLYPYKQGAKAGSGSKDSSETYKAFRMKGMGGLSGFNFGDFATQSGSLALSFNLHFVGEIAYSLSPKFALAARVEDVVNNSQASDSQANQSFNFQMSALPILLGGEIQLGRSKKWSSRLSFFAAYASNISLGVTETTAVSTPNSQTLSAPAMGGEALFDLSYALSPSFSLGGELGYRYLRSAPVTAQPESAVRGGYLFQTTGGAVVPIPLDLSGPFLNLGISLAF